MEGSYVHRGCFSPKGSNGSHSLGLCVETTKTDTDLVTIPTTGAPLAAILSVINSVPVAGGFATQQVLVRIPPILRPGDLSYVIPTVIRGVAVFMVSQGNRPPSGHIKEGETSGMVRMTTNAQPTITILIYTSSNFTATRSIQPSPNTRVRIIVQSTSKLFVSNHKRFLIIKI